MTMMEEGWSVSGSWVNIHAKGSGRVAISGIALLLGGNKASIVFNLIAQVDKIAISIRSIGRAGLISFAELIDCRLDESD